MNPYLQRFHASRSFGPKQGIQRQLAAFALLHSSRPETPELLLKQTPHVCCHLNQQKQL